VNEKSRANTMGALRSTMSTQLGGESSGGKRGRCSENKVPFIAAVQTNRAGQPVPMCLKKLGYTKEAIANWARKSLCASAQVLSDGLWCFQRVTVVGASHQRTVTGGGAASVKLEQFRAVNTVLGNLETAFRGTCHAFDFAKYGHRYLAEVQYRFNRHFDLSVILAQLLRASAVTSQHPVRIIRVAEHDG